MSSLFPATAERAAAMGTAPREGLAVAQVVESRKAHGENRLPETKSRSVWSMFLTALGDKTLIILMGAALLSIGVELLQAQMRPGHQAHYLDGVAILVAVLIASLVTTLNEARAAKQFRLLSKVREDVPVKVLRDGHVRSTSIYDVVVGDVVYFESGDKLPADGLLLLGVDVALDESMLTGESMPASKGEEDLILRGATAVTSGTGAMLVTAVGAASEIGKLQLSLTDGEEGQTPLQERLGHLADKIGYFGLFAAVLTFVALAASAVLREEIPFAATFETLSALLSFAIIAVTIIVVAVPEGLPLAVTISLAYSVRKMARENNLVRKLASCETMGAATVVCSDKTGTLTKNRMSVVAAWIGGQLVDGLPEASELPPEDLERFSDIATINSTAFLEEADGVLEYVGNPTECALLALVASWRMDWRGRRLEAQLLRQLGFTSDRKRMSTLVAGSDGARLLVKGAPEMILGRAAEIAAGGGRTRPVTPEDRALVNELVTRFSAKGHRTLALGYRDGLPPGAEAMDPESLEAGWVFFALVAIADPVRPEVAAAVAACRSAGVDVKVVTGDNALTARTIGEQIGLFREGDLVLEGPEFRAKSDDELRPLLERLRVLARSVPSDKLRLVNLLKSGGHVVAVTGDGTNDAPALKAADVGFSMGLTGTEVAKEASDIVLLDDNFASIVSGIQWGRSIFENIRKFLQFQLTVNVVALSTAFLAAILGFGVPLNTVQLLWVNLIMDTLAALALATEPPTEALFRQPPHGRHAPLITRSMWANILGIGALMIAVLLLAMQTPWFIPEGATRGQGLTFIFNTFVLMHIFNEVNARATRFDRSPFANLAQSPLFITVVVGTVVAQALIVTYGGAFFRTEPLTGEMWLRSALLGTLMLLAGALLRFVGRRLPKAWFEEPARFEGRLPAPEGLAAELRGPRAGS